MSAEAYGKSNPRQVDQIYPATPGSYGYGGYGGVDVGATGQIDLRFLLGILRRRKFLIGAITLFATVAAYLYAAQLTPLYQATAEILIDPERQNVVNIEKVQEGLSDDWLTTETEAAIIGSQDIALKVVNRLELERDPLFNWKLRRPEPSLKDVALGWLTGEDPRTQTAQLELEPLENYADNPEFRDSLARVFRSGLDVDPAQRGRLIDVSYVSTDPETAMRAANATAQVYIDELKDSQGRATSEATDWLTKRVAEVQEELLAAERELERYRQENRISGEEGVSLPTQQLSQLNADLITAMAELDRVQLQHSQVQSLENNPGAVESAGAVLTSSLIQSLKVQEVQLRREIAELATVYRDGHPKMIQAKADLSDLRGQIQAEINKISGNLKNERDLAAARVSRLKAAIAEREAEINVIDEARVDLRALESRVDAKQQLHDTLLQRLAETDVQQDNELQRADVKLISAASIPRTPFYPRTKLIVVMALLASLIFSVVLAIALEFMDSGFRSLAQIEAQTNLPTLGMLPKLAKKRRKKHPHLFATDKQGSLYAESVRTLRTALMLSNPTRPPQTILITSSMPGEGKTSTALSIACQSVMTGRSCLVIDCDLRQPGLGYALGKIGRKGLGDYLVGDCELEDIVGHDEATGLDFIGAGTGAVRPVEHLASPRMQKLLQEMAKRYQMVLIDTPPVLAVSDALPLLREVDATVFLVRWEKTKRDIAKAGLKLVLESGANLAGVVLSNVDVRKHSQYDYADSGYYYHKSYRKYYAG